MGSVLGSLLGTVAGTVVGTLASTVACTLLGTVVDTVAGTLLGTVVGTVVDTVVLIPASLNVTLSTGTLAQRSCRHKFPFKWQLKLRNSVDQLLLLCNTETT